MPLREVPFGGSAPAAVPTDPLWRELAGQTLRATRHVREQTLAHVAGRAGVSVQYLSEIERGRKEPSSEVLAAVAGALDLSLSDLLFAVTRRLDSFRQPSYRRITTSEPTGPVALAA